MNDQYINWWNAQKDNKWKELIISLKSNSEIHSRLDKFIKTFYWNFRKQKGIAESYKPTIVFQGFKEFTDFPNEGKMGHCESDVQTTWSEINGEKIVGSEKTQGTMSIVLSQKFLLDRLGMDKFITDYLETSEGSQWNSLPIGFPELIVTIAHELAHAFQFIKNDDKVKSQCESTGQRDNSGNLLYPQLAAEHAQLTSEIQSLITSSSEFSEFKHWWSEGNKELNSLEEKNYTDSQKIRKEKTLVSAVEQNNQIKREDEPLGKRSDLWIGLGIGTITLIGFVYFFIRRNNKKNY